MKSARVVKTQIAKRSAIVAAAAELSLLAVTTEPALR